MPECELFIINNELVRKQKDDKEDDSMVEKPKESMINNVS